MSKRISILLLIVINFPLYAINIGQVNTYPTTIVEKSAMEDSLAIPLPPVDTSMVSESKYEPIPSSDPEYARDGLLRIIAYDAWRREDYEVVVKELNKLIKPNAIDLEFLTKAYIKLGKWQEALATGKKINTNNPDILTNIGIIAIVNQYYKPAIGYLERAIQMRQDYHRAYQYLGNVYYILDDNQKAIKNWKLAKDYKSAAKYLDYFIGVAYFKLKDFESAIHHFEQVSKDQDVWYAFSIYYLSYLAFRNKDIQRANEVVNRIIIPSLKFSPVELDILKKQIYCNYILGVQAFESDEKDEALEYFIKAEYLIGSHSLELPKYANMAIIRGILIRLMEELQGDKEKRGSNLYFSKLLSDLEYYIRENEQFNEYIKILVNIIYLFSEDEIEKKLAEKCYQSVLDSDLIVENNYYCLFPDSMSYLYKDNLKNLKCSEITLYLIYNMSRILYYKEMYQETLVFIDIFENCISSIFDFKYKNEFLFELLNIKAKIVKEIYKDDLHKVNRLVKQIDQRIALIPKDNLKPIPQYELLNNETEFIAIFVI